MGNDVETVTDRLLALLSELDEQQHAKLHAAARRSVPSITADDLKNPDDFAVLHHDPRFNYEDGVLAGIRATAAAVRALLRTARSGDLAP